MASERGAPAAGGTGGAATEAEVEAAARGIILAQFGDLFAGDEAWPETLHRHRALAHEFGRTYLDGNLHMARQFRDARAAVIAAAAARAPSPAEAERDALHARELALMAEALTAAAADAARARDLAAQAFAAVCEARNFEALCGNPTGLARLLIAAGKSLGEIIAPTILVDHAPAGAGPAGADGGLKQSVVSLSLISTFLTCSANGLAAENSDANSTPTSEGDGHGR